MIDSNYAIRMAANNGHLGIVKLLMSDERVDPTNPESRAERERAEK